MVRKREKYFWHQRQLHFNSLNRIRESRRFLEQEMRLNSVKPSIFQFINDPLSCATEHRTRFERENGTTNPAIFMFVKEVR